MVRTVTAGCVLGHTVAIVSHKGQGAHPDLKPRLQAVFPEHALPALSVRQHLSRKGGMGAGSTDNQGMQRAGCRCLCSVWTESGGFVTQS